MIKRRLRCALLVLMVFVLLASLWIPIVYADRGMLPVTSNVSISEPGQKAILAWNGEVEIMILSTDVQSSQETLVVEILPLPSEPLVEAASYQSFEEIQQLIENEGVNTYTYGTKGLDLSRGVDVVFHEEIGAHNITVVRASIASELESWIIDFLENSGVQSTVSLGNYGTVVKNYMDRGFRYYVLDLITFSIEEQSVDPILYRFSADFLYYPLVITSPVGGDTEITLFTITENKIDQDFAPFQNALYRLREGGWQPIEFVLSKGDLSKVDLRIGAIFEDMAWLTVLKYSGKVSELDKDFMVSTSLSITPLINVEVLWSPVILVLAILLGAVCTLLGGLFTLLITRWTKRIS